MPTLVQCPTCQKQLRVPDHLLGKKVRCPSCREIFVGGAAPEDLPLAPLVDEEQSEPAPRRPAPRQREEDFEEQPAARRRRPVPAPEEEEEQDVQDDFQQEEEYADEDERERRHSRSADWGKVRTGIGLVLLSICIVIAMIVVTIIGGIMVAVAAAAAARAGPGAAVGGARGMTAITVIVGIMGLGAEGVALAGYVLCLGAPTKNNARNLAIATLALAVPSLLLTGIEFIMGLSGGAQAAGPGVTAAGAVRLIANLISLVKFFVFLFFLRAAARCLKARTLVDNIRNLMILFGTTIGGFVLMMVLAFVALAGVFAAGAAAQQGAAPGQNVAAGVGGAVMLMGACVCIDMVLLLAGAIWYIVILVQMRGQIAYRVG